ncbi:hypothetical protein V8C42DRAFT_325931 [Trichoderma barbatum]
MCRSGCKAWSCISCALGVFFCSCVHHTALNTGMRNETRPRINKSRPGPCSGVLAAPVQYPGPWVHVAPGETEDEYQPWRLLQF